VRLFNDKKEMAKRIATHTDKDPTVVYESEKIVPYYLKRKEVKGFLNDKIVIAKRIATRTDKGPTVDYESEKMVLQ
jgi:hypothetical protein